MYIMYTYYILHIYIYIGLIFMILNSTDFIEPFYQFAKIYFYGNI